MDIILLRQSTMWSIAAILVVGILCPLLVSSQLRCHRCFGSGHCNNGTSPDFINDERLATCNVPFDDNDTVFGNLQNAINEYNSMTLENQNKADPHTVLIGECVTATVHEPQSSHTLRTCLTRNWPVGHNQTLCELIEVILNQQNVNWFGGEFTCRACNGTHLCNEHTLTWGDGLEETTTTTTTSTTTTSTTTTTTTTPPSTGAATTMATTPIALLGGVLFIVFRIFLNV